MKIYYVNGICWEDDGFKNRAYAINPGNNVFDTLEKAKAFILDIMLDTRREAQEGGYHVEFNWYDEIISSDPNEKLTLEINFSETGTLENWVIFEREVK